MGDGTRPGGLGHTIRTFWPDDTDEEFFIEASARMSDIMERAREKWGDKVDGDSPFENVGIEAEYIHTDCLGYDRYDSSDYTKFLRIYLED